MFESLVLDLWSTSNLLGRLRPIYLTGILSKGLVAMRVCLFLFCLISSTPIVYADDSEYEKIRDTIFWLKIYNSDYETLYCGVEMSSGSRVTVEHVYPASWIAKALGCKDRNSCSVQKYKEASSDLHNLWPAEKRYNSSRRDLRFGEIEGETPRFENSGCDFERTTGKNAVVEPRDEVKGVIARSFLYMVHWYDLPTNDLLPLMVQWHLEYPPTEKELKRHSLIEKIQSRTNPFITGEKE